MIIIFFALAGKHCIRGKLLDNAVLPQKAGLQDYLEKWSSVFTNVEMDKFPHMGERG